MVGLRRAKTVLLVLVVVISNTIATGAPLDPGPKGSGAAAPLGATVPGGGNAAAPVGATAPAAAAGGLAAAPAGAAGSLDVKAAGAKGDGTTDDTAVRTKSDITCIIRFYSHLFY